MRAASFSCLFFVSLRSTLGAGILNQRSAPTIHAGIPLGRIAPAVCTSNLRRQLLPAICAASREFKAPGFFYPVNSGNDEKKKLVEQWGDIAKYWSAAAKVATMTGWTAGIAKLPFAGMVQSAKEIARPLSKSAREAKLLEPEEPEESQKKSSGFGGAKGGKTKKKNKGNTGYVNLVYRKDSAEAATSWSVAASAWDEAITSAETGSAKEWTASGARTIAIACRELSKLATAADIGEVAMQWNTAASEWEAASQQLKAQGKSNASAKTSPNLDSILIIAVTSLLAGIGIKFVTSNWRRRALTVSEEPLLAT